MRKAEERYCSNCRAPLPAGAAECPSCGVYAGDLFDGKIEKPKTPRRVWPWLLVLLLLAGGAGAWIWFRTSIPIPYVRSAPARVDTGPILIVAGRPGGARKGPGAAINEAEAVRLLRRSLAAANPQMRPECLALLSHGYRSGAYVLSAVNSCDGTRLGKWRVDGKSGKVSRAL